MGYRNSEYYADPTAGMAVSAVKREEDKVARENHDLMSIIRWVSKKAGFEIVGRITLKHIKTGRVFK